MASAIRTPYPSSQYHYNWQGCSPSAAQFLENPLRKQPIIHDPTFLTSTTAITVTSFAAPDRWVPPPNLPPPPQYVDVQPSSHHTGTGGSFRTPEHSKLFRKVREAQWGIWEEVGKGCLLPVGRMPSGTQVYALFGAGAEVDNFSEGNYLPSQITKFAGASVSGTRAVVPPFGTVDREVAPLPGPTWKDSIVPAGTGDRTLGTLSSTIDRVPVSLPDSAGEDNVALFGTRDRVVGALSGTANRIPVSQSVNIMGDHTSGASTRDRDYIALGIRRAVLLSLSLVLELQLSPPGKSGGLPAGKRKQLTLLDRSMVSLNPPLLVFEYTANTIKLLEFLHETANGASKGLEGDRGNARIVLELPAREPVSSSFLSRAGVENRRG